MVGLRLVFFLAFEVVFVLVLFAVRNRVVVFGGDAVVILNSFLISLSDMWFKCVRFTLPARKQQQEKKLYL